MSLVADGIGYKVEMQAWKCSNSLGYRMFIQKILDEPCSEFHRTKNHELKKNIL